MGLADMAVEINQHYHNHTDVQHLGAEDLLESAMQWVV